MTKLLELVAGVATGPNGAGDLLLMLLIAGVCLAVPTLVLFLRPVDVGKGKRFWIGGAVYEVAVQLIAWAFSWDNAGRCVLALALAAVEYMLLRGDVQDRRRLGVALGVQAVGTMVLSVVLHALLVMAVAVALYG